MKRGQEQPKTVSKSQAIKTLGEFQRYAGIALIASAAFGIYLLATDKSLWLLAVSHAYGLVVICSIDIILGAANLLSKRKAIILSSGWALLTLVLQLGDIATAPQYKMTVQYFAGYLFSLWAFDAILLMQGAVIAIGLSARTYQKTLARKKRLTYFEMGFKNSRRDFLQIMGTIGALVALTGVLGAWAAFSSSQSSPPPSPSNTGTTPTQTSNLPSGAVANVSQLQLGVPAYFDYPSSGYTNMLMKNADGSVSALSILCTHVCCQLQYDTSSKDLYCPCHGSIFDQSGNVLRGPAATPLPKVQVSIDSNGNIFPVKIVGSGPCVSGS